MNAFVELVKASIKLVNNNKLFTVILIAVAALLAFFRSPGTAFAAVFCVLCIRAFAAIWSVLKSEDPTTRLSFRTFCIGAIVFLSAPLIGIVNDFIPDTSVWHEYIGSLAYIIGCIGGGIIGMWLALNVIFSVLVPIWQKMVRWANQ